MTILLTGATGFVGRQVLRILIDKGIPTRCVVREGKQSQLASSVVVTKDLFSESKEWWKETCKGIDTVIHCAWYAEPGKYLTSAKNVECLAGTLNMARGAMEAGVRRFVGIGTCFEYDLSGGTLSVDTPLNPITPYARAKAEAFLLLSDMDFEFAWCRLFYLYGEGEDTRRLIPYLRAQLAAGKPAELTSGSQIRDFMDVKDAAKKIVDIALGDKTGPVNICSSVPVMVRNLAEKVADEYGRRDLLKFGARPDNLVDPQYVVGI
jgi:nucleoside-diphosphate-sugar epimerase